VATRLLFRARSSPSVVSSRRRHTRSKRDWSSDVCSSDLARRDKQTAEKAVYLFAVSSPRQANRQKCCLSVRGEFAVTSNSPKQPFNYSRRVRRDKQTAVKAVYLFAESPPRQATV